MKEIYWSVVRVSLEFFYYISLVIPFIVLLRSIVNEKNDAQFNFCSQNKLMKEKLTYVTLLHNINRPQYQLIIFNFIYYQGTMINCGTIYEPDILLL